MQTWLWPATVNQEHLWDSSREQPLQLPAKELPPPREAVPRHPKLPPACFRLKHLFKHKISLEEHKNIIFLFNAAFEICELLFNSLGLWNVFQSISVWCQWEFTQPISLTIPFGRVHTLSGCWMSWITSMAAQKMMGKMLQSHPPALHMCLHPWLAQIPVCHSGWSPAASPESPVQRGGKGPGTQSCSLWQHPQKCSPDVSCTKMLAGLQVTDTEGLTIVTQQ